MSKYPIAATAFIFCGTIFAQTSGNAVTAADKSFVMKAAQSGMAEMELGQLAQEKASSQDVKDFGKRMVDDHGKANDELKQVASKNNITLPTGLDAKDEALKKRLSGLSGDAFDRAYMQHMVNDHKKDVAEFQRASNHATNSDVKEFAKKTLPTLKEHLKMAQDTRGKVAGGKMGVS